ncbi:hypothetical protein EW145_g5913 [Phellinidium pouzarii]|uniref:Uncharacterized protein n=1 Tax=Phellinidium pouzarii TaxID=167371 RepID=A0A4S4KZK1_9AGAM|nr:hypothetical protein EW145_g5913 [Phellinidium pouzarii]
MSLPPSAQHHFNYTRVLVTPQPPTPIGLNTPAVCISPSKSRKWKHALAIHNRTDEDFWELEYEVIIAACCEWWSLKVYDHYTITLQHIEEKRKIILVLFMCLQ